MKRQTAERSSQEFEAFVTETAGPCSVRISHDCERRLRPRICSKKRFSGWRGTGIVSGPWSTRWPTPVGFSSTWCSMGRLARPDRGQELTAPRRACRKAPTRNRFAKLSGIDDQAEFRWALTALPPRQRAVLILRYWDDLSERRSDRHPRLPDRYRKEQRISSGATELRSVSDRVTTRVHQVRGRKVTRGGLMLSPNLEHELRNEFINVGNHIEAPDGLTERLLRENYRGPGEERDFWFLCFCARSLF